jgi:hypothetical protein
MPIDNYESCCEKYAKRIVSKDVGEPKHVGNNPKLRYVTHYKVDGVIIKDGLRCDYVLMNEDDKRAYLIELKGSKLSDAAKQIEATENKLKKYLTGYALRYRIVANRSKTQQIESSDFKRYRERWKNALLYKTNKIEEEI